MVFESVQKLELLPFDSHAGVLMPGLGVQSRNPSPTVELCGILSTMGRLAHISTYGSFVTLDRIWSRTT